MDNISINDYASGAGLDDSLFGQVPQTAEAVSQLNKALEAGGITGGSSVDSAVAGQGAALKVESLERQLKLLTFRDSDIRLFRLFPKSAAFNTVEEFNQLSSYGADRGGSYLEGELPDEEDSTYIRRSEQVKFYGVTKSVTHPMQLVNNTVGSIMQREITNGTMWLLRKVNKSLAFGNANIIPTEVNGAYRQHQIAQDTTLSNYFASEVVIDLKGAPLTQEKIEDAGRVILENFGNATHVFAAPKVLSDFGKDYFSKQRILLGQSNYNQGINISYPKQVTLSFGDVALEQDIFLQASKAKASGAGADSTKAPTAPVADGVTPIAAVADASSQFDADSAGTFVYAVAAVNRYGESALTTLGAATAIAAGEAAELKFTDGGGANAATGYTIYRTKDGETTPFYPIFQVSTSELANGYDGGAAGLVRDRARFLADTEQAFIADVPNVFEIKQLAPLMKMDLAVLSPANRFMILMYWTLFLFAGRKIVRFVNIGRYVAP